MVGLAALATFVCGAVFSRWQEKRRRTPEQAAERAVIDTLWRLAKRAPTGQLFDAVTGHYLGVDRHHGLLEVLISEVDFTSPNPAAGSVVTTYGLGAAGRPMLAPILRQRRPINPHQLPDRTLREAVELLRFNDQTGEMDTSADELTVVHAHLERALHAVNDSPETGARLSSVAGPHGTIERGRPAHEGPE